jgi:FAD/FMN-containing dehydrogenase
MSRPTDLSRRGFLGSVVAAGAAGLGLKSPVAAALAGASRRTPRVGGRVVTRGDADYEQWRQGMPWQMLKPARYPDLIVRARDTTDVVRCVNFARRNGLRLAVRSGGHHVWSNFLRDGGMLLDLALLRDAKVDVERRLAWAGPSIWGRNLIGTTLPHGLGFPVAHCATVPLGGFLLGGGFGLNGDEWGTMSCFAVEGAEVVTAAGDVIEVDARRNPDYFWALRGAGNGFPGVVTRFRLRLFEAPPTVLASTYIFPAARLVEVAALGSQLARSAPPHAEILGIAAIGGQDADGRNKVICALRVAVFAPAEEARVILEALAAQPLAAAAIMKMEQVPSDWDAMFLDSVDASRGFGFGRYAVDSLWTGEPGEVLPAMGERLAASPSPLAHVVVQFKTRTHLPSDAALSVIAPAYVGVYAVWRDAALDATAIGWLRSSMAPLQKHAAGHYINEVDAEARPERIAGSFSTQAWKRLTRFRRQADPSGLFQDFFDGRS